MKAVILLFSSLLAAQTPTTVKLQVSGLPPGQSPLPTITVTLPSGKNQTIPSITDFTSNEPGRYRVNGEPFRLPGPIVDRVLEAPPIDRLIKPGESVALQLTYRQRPGSGMLWAATARIDADTDDFSQGTIRALDDTQLQPGGFTKPSSQMLSGPRLAGGIAAPDGSFYFVDGWTANALMRLPPTSLQSTGTAKASRVPNTEAHAYGLSPAGDLWSLHDRTLKHLSSASLTPSKPIVELTIRDEDDALPATHFLFTSTGDLLLYGPGHVARIPVSKLSPGQREIGKGDAAAILTFDSGTIGHGALDETGNLWLPDENSEVIQLPAAALENGGNTRGERFSVPQSASAIRVDNQGGVWCLIRYTGDLFYRAPGASAFAAKGSFGHGFDEHTQLTLHPPPAWSPLAAAPAFPKRLTP